MQIKLNREHWSSRLGFILAATGAAVGLGNIWKFPHMIGEHGGAAFVLVYLICTLCIGLPMMLAEIVIGRHGQKNMLDSLRDVAIASDATSCWRYLGWLGVCTLLLILSFYSVVAGWTIPYIFYAWGGFFAKMPAEQINQLWGGLVSNPWATAGWSTLFLILTMWIVARGIQKGLEKASCIMMPALFVMLTMLVIYAMTTGDAWEALHFLFDFKWQDLTPKIMVAAMGQAAFSLAVGAGCMLVYGTYLSKQTRLFSSAFIIAGADAVVALLAGLAIFPIVFANQLAPQSGAGLMFQILPLAFGQMTAGGFFGGLFFVFLLFAAWTSSISLAEPAVSILIERTGMRRHCAALLVGIAVWLPMIACALSFNLWSDFKVLGQRGIFETITDLVTNILLPIGGILFVIFASWIMSQKLTREEFAVREIWYRCWLYLSRFVVPIAIVLIMVTTIL